MRCKSKTFAIALGIVSITLMSLGQASAAPPVVRDHRDKPVVRDHRGDGASGGGVTVKSSGTARKPKKKMWCIGIPCI
jgi:hypothetical protein